jgi:hypothetical protein
MKRSLRSFAQRPLALLLLVLAAPLSLLGAQEKTPVPPGGTVNVTVTAATPPAPPVSIILGDRHGHTTPVKGKCAHTGGGLTDVAQPTPDTVIVTMSGAVVANASMQFDLDQCFEVSFDDPKVKRANLTIEGRVVGLLRGEKKGCAEYSEPCASVLAGPTELVTICVPVHSACDHQSLAVNDHAGPRTVPIVPGKYTLHQAFGMSATTDSYVCKRPSAEFAPDPALDPLWISYFEPFHGVKKDTFGFQVIVKVAEDTSPAGSSPGVESLPKPTPDRKPGAQLDGRPQLVPLSRNPQ